MVDKIKFSERKISAGSYDLNKFLFGGYEKDIITTIYGPAGSGKTNFCLMISVSQAKKGNKVIFIDTEGGFSIERIRQLAGENYESILENIILLRPTSFAEQKEAFTTILNKVKASKIGAIIVDGITMLYRLELEGNKENSEKIREANRELAKQLRMLAEISGKKEIPVIVTNQIYYEFQCEEDFRVGKEKTSRMVGGDLLRYWSKCLIELTNNKGKRKLILRKHRSLPEKELVFEIINDGIRKKGWI
jgi:DNA repair protein RadB